MRKQRNSYYWSEERQQWRKRFKGDDGKYHDAWGDTKKACDQRKTEMEAEITAKLGQLPTGSMFFYEYAARWFKLNMNDVKETSRENVAGFINNHICPVIGRIPLDQLKQDDVLEVMAAVSGKSKSTQKKILGTMRRILKAAEANDLIKKNPSVGLKAGGKPPEEKVALTKQQQKKLLTAVTGTVAETFVRLCLYTGMRREEALGLQWDAVHLDAVPPYIEVRRAVNWTPKTGAPSLVEDLKSKAARRKIPLPDDLADYLRQLKKNGSLVIHNTTGGPMSKQSFRRMWEAVKIRTADEEHPVGSKVKNHKIVRTLDFHVTPHLLRHTYISELIISGANIKTVQYLAGHATVTITLQIYTHLMENQPEDTVTAVAGAFGVKSRGQDNKEKTAEC